MRLSTVFELLLIFLLIAFAAYGNVIGRNEASNLRRNIRNVEERKQTNMGVEMISLKQAAENVNKYCTCNENICNCCRNFNIPIVQLKGPGCASLQYLEEDKLAVQLSVGDNILTSTVVNGQKPKAVCFPMPGGLTKFCGRIYSIQREADNHFKACLALELQSSTELEAALRISCFRFGPDGVKLRPAEQLPVIEADKPAEDDDDDDDIFGLGDDDDDDDDEEDDDEDAPEGNAVPDSSATNNESDDDDDDDDDDVLGFGALLDILTGEDESNKKKKKPAATTAAPILPFTIPILTKPTVGLPSIENNVNSDTLNSVKPIAATTEAIGQSIIDTSLNNDVPTAEVSSDSDDNQEIASTESTSDFNTVELSTSSNDAIPEESNTETTNTPDDIIAIGTLNKDVFIDQPDKPSNFKKVSSASQVKPSLTSNSINSITNNDGKKPSVVHKPIKLNPTQTYVATHNDGSNEDEDEDDDDNLFGTSDFDDDDDDDDDEKLELEDDDDDDEDDEKEEEDEDEKVDEETLENVEEDKDENEADKVDHLHEEDEDEEDLVDDDDDDEDEEDKEEDAVLAALVEDDKDDKKIKNKVADNEAANPEEDDPDYGLGLAELLARKRYMRSGRQSKVMRLEN